MFWAVRLKGGSAKRSAEAKTRRGFWRVHDIGLRFRAKSLPQHHCIRPEDTHRDMARQQQIFWNDAVMVGEYNRLNAGLGKQENFDLPHSLR
jgi:hypothetical protein